MNKSLYICLIVFCVSTFTNTWAQNRKFSFNELYKVSDSPRLNVSANDGDVEIYPSDKNEIEVFYIVERNNQLLDITRSELEEEFTIDISSGKDFLDISIKEKYPYRMMDWRNRINVSFEIYTPFKTRSDIDCSDGDIRMRGLKNDQKLQSSDGDIEVLKIEGDVYVKTSDGDIYVSQVTGEVEPITSDGDMDIKDVKGNVEGRTSDGDVSVVDVIGDVNLVTSDGDVRAEDITGEIYLRSSDGDIRLHGSTGLIELATSDGSITFSDLRGSLKAKTSDGRIRGNMLSLDSSIELRTSDGSIDVVMPGSMGLDLMLRGETIRTRLDNFSGTAKDHLVEGEINGGGKLVSLQALGGTVSLTYE